MHKLISEVQAQMDQLPTWVQLWVNWMMLIFICSVFFVRKHRAARIVFMAFILTMPIAIAIFQMTKSVHLFGIAHLIVWLPLLIYLVRNQIQNSSFGVKSAFDIWFVLLLVTITVSLPFDVRDIVMVTMGKK